MSGDPAAPARFYRLAGFLSKAGGWFELLKVHLSLYIAVSAVFGHGLAMGRLFFDAVILGGWVFLLSAGAGGLNNFQDREFDRHFHRTRCRVLPENRIRPGTALLMSFFFILLGLGGLYNGFESRFPFFGGLAGLIGYNGLYTPLKKKNLLAYLPGILCGTLPPAIGWTAALPGVPSPGAHLLLSAMLVMGLWQIPHFLILELNRPDGGRTPPGQFPGFARQFSVTALKYHIAIWTTGYGLAILVFLAAGGVSSRFLAVTLAGMAVLLPVCTVQALRSGKYPVHRGAAPSGFIGLNLSMLAFLGCGILDRILL